MFWHLNMVSRVKWEDSLSDEFSVPLGTKQGGISSPGYFAIYIDDIAKILRRKGVGCHIRGGHYEQPFCSAMQGILMYPEAFYEQKNAIPNFLQ